MITTYGTEPERQASQLADGCEITDTSTGALPAGIGFDIPCVKCAYNLRGLNSVSVCPECGERIANSDRLPRLMFSAPKWLARVQLGLMVVVTAPVVPIVIFLADYVSEKLIGPSRWRFPWGGSNPWVVVVITYTLEMFGVIMATSRDPSVQVKFRLTLWRTAARLGACLGALGTTSLLLGQAHLIEDKDVLALVIQSGAKLIGFGTLVAAAGLFFWLEHLAARNLDTSRARSAWLAVGILVCGEVATRLLRLVPLPTSSPGLELRSAGSALLEVGPWVFAWLVTCSFRRLLMQERRLGTALVANPGAT